jgi:hypothetical protein
MAKKQNRSKDPDIISSEKALRSAARRALQIGLETGTAVWVIKRGKMVDLTQEYHRKTKRKLIVKDSAPTQIRTY